MPHTPSQNNTPACTRAQTHVTYIITLTIHSEEISGEE